MNFTNKQLQAISCLKRTNFESTDFFVSEIADKNNIINLPSTKKEADFVINNLMVVADKIQQIRNILKQPIIINSAYRCQLVNRLINSKDTSQHLKGEAIDFICPKFGNPSSIFLTLFKEKIEVDQCLLENSWIHLSIKSKNNRNIWGKLINGKFDLVK